MSTTITFADGTLARAIRIAEAHTSRDIALPALHSIQMIVHPDGVVRFLTTDRYQGVIVQARARVEASEEHKVLIPLSIHRDLCRSGRGEVGLTILGDDARALRVDMGNRSLSVTIPDDTYPDLLTIFRNHAVSSPREVEGVNADLLRKISAGLPKGTKVQLHTRETPSSERPALMWTAAISQWAATRIEVVGLIMPMRIDHTERTEAAELITRVLA